MLLGYFTSLCLHKVYFKILLFSVVEFDWVCKISWPYRYGEIRCGCRSCDNVVYISCTGICEVEPTPKGWFIKYIDRDPETIKRQAVGWQPPQLNKRRFVFDS